MKTKIISIALFTALSAMSVNALAAVGNDTVTLSGTVTNTTCDVTVNGGNPTFGVGTIKANAFTNAFTGYPTSNSTNLQVVIDNCSGGSSAYTGDLVVSGTTPTADGTKTIFASSSTDKVGFTLTETATSTLIKNKDQISTSVPVAAGSSATHNFKIAMAATALPVTTGTYTAQVNFAFIEI